MTSSTLLTIAHLILQVNLPGMRMPRQLERVLYAPGKVFQEEISIWSVYQVKTCPPQCGHEGLIEQRWSGRVNFLSLFLGWDDHLLLPLRSSRFSGLWIWGLDTRGLLVLIIQPDFLILQFAESRLWDFSSSITRWANSYNKFLLIITYVIFSILYIYLIGSVV